MKIVVALLMLAAACTVVGAGCPAPVAAPCENTPAGCGPPLNNDPPRFFADPPFGVGFECVTIGCDTEKPLSLENRGGGTLGIALVRPTVDTSSDYTIARADGEPLPFTGSDDDENDASAHVLLGASEKLALIVSYVPTDGELDQGAVLVEHYDAALPFVDAAPVEDEIAISARALGTPAAVLPIAVLDFGFVELGDDKTLELVIENAADESVLTVGPLDRADGTAAVFHPGDPRDWGQRFANPGVSAIYKVVFTPTSADAFFGELVLATNDPLRPEVRVLVQGTAIAEPRLAVVDPIGDLALAPVRAGETRTGVVTIRNLGGAPLDATPSLFAGEELGLSVAPLEGIIGIAPLATAQVTVSLTSSNGGAVNGILKIIANDPATLHTVTITGEVEAPLLSSSPSFLDLGDVVQGWSAVPGQIAIANTGFGELTITSISFEVGSSDQIALADVPPLPVKLSPGEEPILLTVLLTAGSVGPADAVVLIASDSIDNGVSRVDVHGDVITCEEGCPTPNGSPRCDSGFCEVGGCVDDFHDADTVVVNGCECTEDVIGNTREDIGQACGQGLDLGGLSDDDGGFTRDGTLHADGDIDLYFIRMSDDTQLFDDEYGGEIVLVNGPPGLQVCANFQDNGTGCGGAPTNCSTTRVRGNGQSGVFGSSDNSEDVTVFVMWQPDAAPQCGNYTIRFDADEDF